MFYEVVPYETFPILKSYKSELFPKFKYNQTMLKSRKKGKILVCIFHSKLQHFLQQFPTFAFSVA